MKRVAAAIASTILSLAGGLNLEPIEDNEWSLAQVSYDSPPGQMNTSGAGHWDVHDNSDLKDQCDKEILDWWEPEGWSIEDVMKYANVRGYHGITRDKNSNIAFLKKCDGKKKVETNQLTRNQNHLVTYLQQDPDYRGEKVIDGCD